jgi:hypothetical protein
LATADGVLGTPIQMPENTHQFFKDFDALFRERGQTLFLQLPAELDRISDSDKARHSRWLATHAFELACVAAGRNRTEPLLHRKGAAPLSATEGEDPIINIEEIDQCLGTHVNSLPMVHGVPGTAYQLDILPSDRLGHIKPEFKRAVAENGAFRMYLQRVLAFHIARDAFTAAATRHEEEGRRLAEWKGQLQAVGVLSSLDAAAP